MAVYHAGLPAVLFDRMAAGHDVNNHPNYILCDRSKEELPVRGDTIVALTDLADSHSRVLKRVFPDAEFPTTTQYYKQNEGVFDQLSILSLFQDRLMSHIWRWHRYVNLDGRIEERETPSSWDCIVREKIFGVNSDTHGWIPPNIYNVIFCTLYEWAKYQSPVLHHLAGVTMCSYIKNFTYDLKQMWPAVAKYTGAPVEIDFIVYPTAHARFVTTENHREVLQDLLSVWLEHLAFQKTKGKKIKNAEPSEKASVIADLRKVDAERAGVLLQHLSGCSEILARTEDEVFHITHHDAAKNGLYVPDHNQNTSFRDLRKLSEFLTKLQSAN